LPTIIAGAGQGAKKRFLEFFTINIRNPNTRAAYHRAAVEFLEWCEARKMGRLDEVQAVHVAAYIKQLGRRLSAPYQATPCLYPYAVRLADGRPGGSG
jgi:site-specific recombinase XerD